MEGGSSTSVKIFVGDSTWWKSIEATIATPTHRLPHTSPDFHSFRAAAPAHTVCWFVEVFVFCSPFQTKFKKKTFRKIHIYRGPKAADKLVSSSSTSSSRYHP